MLPTRSNDLHSAQAILLFDQLWSLGSRNRSIKQCLGDVKLAVGITYDLKPFNWRLFYHSTMLEYIIRLPGHSIFRD